MIIENKFLEIGWQTIGLLFIPYLLSSEVVVNTKESDTLLWAMNYLIIIITIIVSAAVLYTIVDVIKMMSSSEQERLLKIQGVDLSAQTKDKGPNFFYKLINSLSGLVPIEKEADLQLDHDYDGIHELDNSLPPWWLYLFYATIAWAGIYFYVYQLSDIGQNQEEEYEISVKEGENIRIAFLAKQADAVDETNVVFLDDNQSLAEGKSIYMSNCLACHGQEGQGGVGPNFTDEYWIHGGGIKDLFKTVKYGVPQKGMISWRSQLSPSDMQKVSSFILTLQGTDPPNAKKRQGKLYVPVEDE